MSEYINKDEFERAVMFSDDEDIQDVIYRLRDFPRADVVEVKRGEWIIREPIHMHSICSCCGYYNAYSPYFNYCPNCGADMRGNEDE